MYQKWEERLRRPWILKILHSLCYHGNACFLLLALTLTAVPEKMRVIQGCSSNQLTVYRAEKKYKTSTFYKKE